MIISDQTPMQYPLPERWARMRLLGDWFACSGCNAIILGYVNTITPLFDSDPAWCFDPSGVIRGELLAQETPEGEFYLPAGYEVTVRQPADALDGHWELPGVGIPCSMESSSESSSSGDCHLSPIPNANSPTITNPDQVWSRKRDPVSGRWCYGWTDTEHCGSGSGS